LFPFFFEYPRKGRARENTWRICLQLRTLFDFEHIVGCTMWRVFPTLSADKTKGYFS
jgi:hypothetical protein